MSQESAVCALAKRPAFATSARSIAEELLTLEPRRRAQAEAIAHSAAPRYVQLYFRALRGELSPRRTIRIMCLHCVGWERPEAERCTAHGCPLWFWRPKIKRAAASALPSPATQEGQVDG